MLIVNFSSFLVTELTRMIRLEQLEKEHFKYATQ